MGDVNATPAFCCAERLKAPIRPYIWFVSDAHFHGGTPEQCGVFHGIIWQLRGWVALSRRDNEKESKCSNVSTKVLTRKQSEYLAQMEFK